MVFDPVAGPPHESSEVARDVHAKAVQEIRHVVREPKALQVTVDD
jgi:hypothetical protein